MKGFLFSVPVLALTLTWVPAQTTNPPTTPKPHVVEVPQPDQPSVPAAGSDSAASLDPAQVAEYEKRFKEGTDLEQAGKLPEARAVYDGILAEQPDAKGSLLHAGEISFKLGELEKADGYLEKLHALVPDFTAATEMLIQINQGLKRDVRAELLVRDFQQLHDSGKIPGFTRSPLFVRERIADGTDEIVVSQFFDYTQDPNTVWMAEVFGQDGQLKRRLLLNYDVAATNALRAKNAKYQTAQVFTWFEHVIKNQRVKEIDAYLQIFALPDYQKFRSAMLILLANPPRPIYSAPVDVPLQSTPQ